LGFCKGLVEIITHANNPIFDCPNLASINVEANNPIFRSENGVLFYENKMLVRYPKGKKDNTYIVPNITVIADFAFEGCSNLKSIIIPDSVDYISFGAFRNCHNLTSITIPKSVNYIGMDAFEYCSNLTSVIIPSSVTNIGGLAFYGCSNLTKIVNYSDNPQQIKLFTFEGVNNDCILHVPANSIDAYKSEYGWKHFNIQSIAHE
jgi:hypothetical protein